jgi:hypothetical protein
VLGHIFFAVFFSFKRGKINDEINCLQLSGNILGTNSDICGRKSGY